MLLHSYSALEMRLFLHELRGDVGSRGFCTVLIFLFFFSSLSHGEVEKRISSWKTIQEKLL